jgi:hypothetical protein
VFRFPAIENIYRFYYISGGTLLVAQLVQALRYKAERSRVRFPITYLYQEYFLGGKRRPVRGADNRTTFMCRLS